MFAALSMYARPEHRAAHDALWALIRDALRARGQTAPDGLDHDAAYDAGWGRADLVLGHICNLPWRARHRHDTQVIGATDFGIAGVPPGYYCSHIIVRHDDPVENIGGAGGHRMVLNDPLSQSGWGAAQALAVKNGVNLRPVAVVGSHRASIEAVATGAADLAAIDAHVWQIETALGNRHLAHLRILAHSAPSPAITFIAAPGRDPAATFDAVAEGIAALPDTQREVLGLRGIVRLPASAYDIALPPAPIFQTA